MASAENLAWLRQTGRRYVIGAPKSELKKFGSELARRDGWRTVHEGVEVKLTRHPDTAHRRLDELADKLAEGREEDAPGQKSKQRDVTILRSLPGVGRIDLTAKKYSYDALQDSARILVRVLTTHA